MTDQLTTRGPGANRSAGGGPRRSGAFDIRTVIAGLIGCYGVVLIIMGLAADTAANRAKTGDVNANLWAGIGLVAVAALFAISVMVRPIVIEPPAGEDADDNEEGQQ